MINYLVFVLCVCVWVICVSVFRTFLECKWFISAYPSAYHLMCCVCMIASRANVNHFMFFVFVGVFVLCYCIFTYLAGNRVLPEYECTLFHLIVSLVLIVVMPYPYILFCLLDCTSSTHCGQYKSVVSVEPERIFVWQQVWAIWMGELERWSWKRSKLLNGK